MRRQTFPLRLIRMWPDAGFRVSRAVITLTILLAGLAPAWADVPPPECEDPCSPGCPTFGTPCCSPHFSQQPPDCNGNGERDVCDIFWGWSEDCNGNDIPDECEASVVCGYERYVYDALGRRIARIVTLPDGTQDVTRCYYDGQNVILETDENDVSQRYFVNGSQYIDERVLMHDAASDEEYYYRMQELYTVAGLADRTGAPVETYKYDAYGKVKVYDNSATRIPKSAFGNPYHFTGRRLDFVADVPNDPKQVQYSRARRYDPYNGRFPQRDPLRMKLVTILPTRHPPASLRHPTMLSALSLKATRRKLRVRQYRDGMNLYEIVQGNPGRYMDPSGLLKECGPWKKNGPSKFEEIGEPLVARNVTITLPLPAWVEIGVEIVGGVSVNVFDMPLDFLADFEARRGYTCRRQWRARTPCKRECIKCSFWRDVFGMENPYRFKTEKKTKKCRGGYTLGRTYWHYGAGCGAPNPNNLGVKAPNCCK